MSSLPSRSSSTADDDTAVPAAIQVTAVGGGNEVEKKDSGDVVELISSSSSFILLPPPLHPLCSLSAKEITVTADIVRQYHFNHFCHNNNNDNNNHDHHNSDNIDNDTNVDDNKMIADNNNNNNNNNSTNTETKTTLLRLRFISISLKEPNRIELQKYNDYYGSNGNSNSTNNDNNNKDHDETETTITTPPITTTITTPPPTTTTTAIEPPVVLRCAEVVVLDTDTGLAHEYVINLTPMMMNTTSNSSSSLKQQQQQQSDELVVSCITLPSGTQPMLIPDDCNDAEIIVQTSIEFQNILQTYYPQITNMNDIVCDPWGIHIASKEEIKLIQYNNNNQQQQEEEEMDDNTNVKKQINPIHHKPARLVQTFLYFRANDVGTKCNHYGHPIDIVPIVDLNEKCIIHIHGLDELIIKNNSSTSTTIQNNTNKIPTTPVYYHRDLLQYNTYLPNTFRTDVPKPLHIIQPLGPSFTVSKDHVITWQKWSIRVGFNYREGMVLYDISFDNRSIMNRASLVEMVVPYGDHHTPYQRKCAFDVGDYGLGYCSNTLELGCDCLGSIYYFDTVLHNAQGVPYEKKKVICLHEIDDGLLWKHVDYRTNHNESRRSRTLIISSIATAVNYEYAFYWIFKLDGTIEYEIKLTGELATNLLSSGMEQQTGKPLHGTIVAPGVNAQIHQHMFCMKLDMAIDGINNTISEVDVESVPYDPVTNPYGNVFQNIETKLCTELDAIRVANGNKGRCWKIYNEEKINPINLVPVSYKLIPFTKGPYQPTLLTGPTSMVNEKGYFATANLFVTPQLMMMDDENDNNNNNNNNNKEQTKERYPAGEYTIQGNGQDGIKSWIQKNRSIENIPLVLWHAFGVTHIPRMEDFPIMPCESTGFTLKPFNFFTGNPTIDLPPETNESSQEVLVDSTTSTTTKQGCCKSS